MTPLSASPSLRRGFTLIELLTVVGVMVLLAGLSIMAFNGIQAGANVRRAATGIAGALDEARTYALANGTYVWVGFFEEDGAKSSTQPPTLGNGGRLVLSIVASQDGTRYDENSITGSQPAAFGAGDASNPVRLVQVGKLVRFDNIRLAALNTGAPSGNIPARPPVSADYQVGDAPTGAPDNARGTFARHVDGGNSNPTTFSYPLSGTVQYTFSKIVEFSPHSEASKIDENVFSGPGPQDAMEIAFLPTHGGTPDPRYAGTGKAAAAIQIEGITGRVKIYQP